MQYVVWLLILVATSILAENYANTEIQLLDLDYLKNRFFSNKKILKPLYFSHVL